MLIATGRNDLSFPRQTLALPWTQACNGVALFLAWLVNHVHLPTVSHYDFLNGKGLPHFQAPASSVETGTRKSIRMGLGRHESNRMRITHPT